MYKCECKLCNSDFPFGCGASSDIIAFHYGKLRTALEEICQPVPDSEVPDFGDPDEAEKWCDIAIKRKKIARKALKP
jgi:hypothetical protein